MIMASNNTKRQLYQPAPKSRAGERKTRKPLVQGLLSQSASCTTETIASARNETQLNADESTDPSMTPCKFIPVLTESLDPKSEAPSCHLDLSDTDVVVRHQESVMVCDASHLASSPNHTEVDVVVNFQQSPAIVVRHTPRSGRLDRSRSSNLTSESNKPSVVVGVPKAVGLTPARLFSNVHDGGDRGALISQHSRGLIKEILTEEMGSQNVDSISLYSYNSSSPLNNDLTSLRDSPMRYPRNSSPIEISNNSSHRSSSHYHNDEKSKSTELVQEGKGVQGKSDNLKIAFDDSADSETLSLYEYVAPQKAVAPNKPMLVEDRSQGHGTASVPLAKSAKKAKGKVVQSRYQQTNATSKSKSSGTSQGRAPTQGGPSSLKTKAPLKKQNASKPASRYASSASLSRKTSTTVRSASQELDGTGQRSRSVRQTSTPSKDLSSLPSYMDASSIQSVSVVSAMSGDASLTFSETTQSLDQDNGDRVLPIHLDLAYTRYLQACFLNSKAKKCLLEQEKASMADLHCLWTLVEKKREEVSKAAGRLDHLKAVHSIDKFLDEIEPQLNALIPKLPQTQRDYAKVCQALDATRHQIPTRDIHLPEGEVDYEVSMESVLRESERLLTQINKTIGDDITPMEQYRTCLEDISHNVSSIRSQLGKGHLDLKMAQGLCSRMRSLSTLK